MTGERAPETENDAAVLRQLQTGWFDRVPARYWLTRFVLLRGLGFVHVVAAIVLLSQMGPLIGSEGLMPAAGYLERIGATTGFWEWPTLFWFDCSDAVMAALAWLDLVLACLLMLGVGNGLLVAALWLIYLSFCHVGQTFWGYGWEMLLLEATFLAIFLCPLRGLRALPSDHAPPTPVIWMLRWLVFRVMFGAGLIKIRGDGCWVELTCLVHHYETQPVPHPLSWLLHQAPLWFHQAGALVNHFVELVVPFGVFGPRRLRHLAGTLLLGFQGMLIFSGNLSFLNWLTLVVCLSCFDDGLLGRLLPRRLVGLAQAREGSWSDARSRRIGVGLLALLVAVLSLGPIFNMLSSRQAMNTSFDPLHLVNSYGAFGSVGKERNEVVLQGTDATVPDDSAHWADYEFYCKPGDVERRPCLITPYHHRLDWQMWFAALGDYTREPWLLHLIYKLLNGDAGARSLIAHDPFEQKPPRYIRAAFYRYRFTRLGDGSDAFWQRERIGNYLEPLSLRHPGLTRFLVERGWLVPGRARAP
ncbi:MAG: lipase maturation factor family protein [Myxococcales bacterium]|nr:lipase maturation factor family protein [Myxococcales bacterium]